MLVPGVVVDVDGYAAEGGDFRGEFIKTRIVLSVYQSLGLDFEWVWTGKSYRSRS